MLLERFIGCVLVFNSIPLQLREVHRRQVSGRAGALHSGASVRRTPVPGGRPAGRVPGAVGVQLRPGVRGGEVSVCGRPTLHTVATLHTVE